MAVSISLSITQNSQNAAANTSNVTVAVTAAWTLGSYNLTNPAGTLTIDGTAYAFNASFNTGQTTSGSQTLFSKTVDVAHNTDGSKTLACSALYHSGVSSGDVTASASKDLTAIPRASTIGATDANIGAVSMIAVNKKSTAYTHSIAYKFGTLSGYITSTGGVSSTEAKFSAASVAFTLPTTFYAQIPNAKTGTCTLTIKTYSGSTQIGEAQTCTFTVTAAEATCAPAVSGTVVDSNETTKALTGDPSKLIRYYSTALCTITATAKNSATISSKTIGGTAVSGTTRTIPNVESGSVAFAATDSRGYSAAASVTAEMIAYVQLTNNAVGTRTDPTSGNATLTMRGNYFNGSFGAADNALEIKYRIGDGEYVTVTPTISGNTYSASVLLTDLDYTQAYTVEVVATDKLASVTKTVTIGEGVPVFDWGKSDFAHNTRVTVLGFPVAGVYDSTNGAGVIQQALNTFTGKNSGAVILTAYDADDPTQYCISLFVLNYGVSYASTVLTQNGLTVIYNSNGTASCSNAAAGHTVHYAVAILAAF